MKIHKLFILGFILLGLGGCYPTAPETSDTKTSAQQEALVQEGVNQTGMPAIVNFQERKLMKMIYEKRDQADLITYTYIIDMQGKRHFLTKSIGYGLPYATQYSSPLKYAWQRSTVKGLSGEMLLVPQAEPNSLFMPESAQGTWILALPPKGGDPQPMYIEPEILVSLWPLD